MSSAARKPEILVIADQERLHGIFDFPGVSCAKAFTLDDGLKSAQRRSPALLFIQSRLGGLSGEILARHIRLELKDKKTRLVLLCKPEDMPAPGNKTFAAAVDISLPDEQLAEQIHFVTDSLLAGKNPKLFREKKKPAEIPLEAVEPAPDQPEPAEEISDVVSIGSRDTATAEQAETAPNPPETPDARARFREELKSALEKAAAEGPTVKAIESAAATADADLQMQPLRTILPEQPQAAIKSRPRKIGVIPVLFLAVILVGVLLLWRFTGTQPAPKTVGTGPQTRMGKPAEKRQTPPATTVRKPDAKPPAAAEVKYLKYTVRPGDTVYTILTKRFGLSSRMAESLIPQVLEKNGLSRNTVLSVGREILIPEHVKIQPVTAP